MIQRIKLWIWGGRAGPSCPNSFLHTEIHWRADNTQLPSLQMRWWERFLWSQGLEGCSPASQTSPVPAGHIVAAATEVPRSRGGREAQARNPPGTLETGFASTVRPVRDGAVSAALTLPWREGLAAGGGHFHGATGARPYAEALLPQPWRCCGGNGGHPPACPPASQPPWALRGSSSRGRPVSSRRVPRGARKAPRRPRSGTCPRREDGLTAAARTG